MPSIHPTALVHPDASIADDVSIGPWCVIEADVSIGSGSVLGAFCRVHAGSALGERVMLDGGAVIGGAPQDLKHAGGSSRVVLGPGTRVGEYATVNRSAAQGSDAGDGETRVGANCLVMAYAHVAHDCELGDGSIIANAVQLGGHVRVGEGAIVSGMTGVHQFTTIGAGAFVGGALRADKDVPPYCRALGDPIRWGGLNLTGMRRNGSEAAAFLDAFYRRVYGEGEAAARVWARMQPGFDAEKAALTDFFDHRKRPLLPKNKI
jgi:UDP-N-acetylglucosamine acyltransferase